MRTVHRCPLCGMAGFPNDTSVVLHMLRERGPKGVTTREIHRGGASGNASQRRTELINGGHSLSKRREHDFANRRLTRYWLTEYAPDDAELDHVERRAA